MHPDSNIQIRQKTDGSIDWVQYVEAPTVMRQSSAVEYPDEACLSHVVWVLMCVYPRQVNTARLSGRGPPH